MKNPFRVNAVNFGSLVWIAFSFYWYLILHKDVSQFTFALALGLIGFYIAHNEKSKLIIIEEHEKRMQEQINFNTEKHDELDKAVDSMNNKFENKFLKNE